MDLSRATDAYIQPLSQEWTLAVGRFLGPQQPFAVPTEHPRRQLLRDAAQQLQSGNMVTDNIIMEYTRILQALGPKANATAIYMDTHALTTLLRANTDGATPKLRALDTVSSGTSAGHIFWIIHHGFLPHWSLVHIHVARTSIVAYDPYPSLNKSFTASATEAIYSYWKKNFVRDSSGWKIEDADWNSYGCVQARESNDCGILCMLLLRVLQGHDRLPKLPIEEEEREKLMYIVGARMRLRIAAELIANQANPSDDQIPTWLKDTP